jgi:hypothetical protein
MGHKKEIRRSTNEREGTPLVSEGPRAGIQFEQPMERSSRVPSTPKSVEQEFGRPGYVSKVLQKEGMMCFKKQPGL